MRVLVTNDDGIASPGLHALAKAVDSLGHEVLVVAPAHNVSGCGTSVGRGRPDTPSITDHVNIGDTGIDGFAIAGTPGLAVLAAIAGRFGPAPDLVVSGINAGLNLGRVIVHSGTVGGALTAQAFGLRSMAVSLAQGDRWHWETAAQLAADVFPWVADLTEPLAVNLNVPNNAMSAIVGIRMARLDALGAFRMRSETGSDELQFEVVWPDVDRDEESDSWLVSEGYATVSALTSIREVFADLAPLPRPAIVPTS